MTSLTLHSHAKLNLYLLVLNIRKDSYHNIKTVFERIDLADIITLKKRSDKLIKVICSHPDVPTDKSNLCLRSVRALQKEFGIKQGVEIKIIKRIPVGAGLGGGSSNAAGVLSGLNKLWGLGLSQNKLAKIAARIGSDVPFFIYNTSFAEGSGRGDVIRALKVPKGIKLTQIVVVPDFLVSTHLIYQKWDRFSHLTRPKFNVKILTLALRRKNLFQRPEALENSLEAVTTRLYPEVSRVKETLAKLGVKTILMSGSGPAVFGILPSRKEAASISKRLQGLNKSWRVFVVRTF